MKINFSLNHCGMLFFVLLCLSCRSNNRQITTDTEQSYPTMTISLCDDTVMSAYPATMKGKQDIDIYPQISGTIKSVCVKEGEYVRKGQTLFVIEQNTYRAALDQAMANAASAKASLATAQLTYENKEKLFKENVISEYELSTAKNTLANAQAVLAQTKAQEASAKTNYNYTVISSPANGIVGELPYFQGALVSPSQSQPLTTVSDNSAMYVYFSITEKQLLDMVREYGSTQEALKKMPDVVLQLSDGTTYAEKGRIESVSGVINQSTGSTSIRAQFPNDKRLLYSGFSGNVVVPSVYHNCIVIPQAATTEIQDKVMAFKVVNGKAQATQITIAPVDNGKEYVVLDGLRENDVIVTSGAGLLKTGMPIKTAKTNK